MGFKTDDQRKAVMANLNGHGPSSHSVKSNDVSKNNDSKNNRMLVKSIGNSGKIGLLIDDLPSNHGTLNRNDGDEMNTFHRLVKSAINTGSITEREELRERIYRMSGIDIFDKNHNVYDSDPSILASILEKGFGQPFLKSKNMYYTSDPEKLANDLIQFNNRIKSHLHISDNDVIDNFNKRKKYLTALKTGIDLWLSKYPLGPIDENVLKKIGDNSTLTLALKELKNRN